MSSASGNLAPKPMMFFPGDTRAITLWRLAASFNANDAAGCATLFTDDAELKISDVNIGEYSSGPVSYEGTNLSSVNVAGFSPSWIRVNGGELKQGRNFTEMEYASGALVAGVLYLRNHDRKWDIVETAGIEIGLVFMLVSSFVFLIGAMSLGIFISSNAHTSQEAMAIQEYRMVQIGPKIDAGGAQPGRTNVP